MATGCDSTRHKAITRRTALKGAAASAAGAIAAPYVLRSARAQNGKILIGFPVPLTGPYGSEAEEQALCAQLAVDQFNEAGGLDGRMAELLVRDDKLNPGEAATRTLELIEQDKAQFIVGSLSASVQLAVNNVTKARGVIYVSISQSDTINEASDWSRFTFHEALNPHITSSAVGRYVFPKYGTRVAFLTADYAFGHELVRGFRRAGKEFGIEELIDVRHPIGHQDFSAFFPQIMALAPDLLIMNNFGRDQLNAVKQASDFGLKEQMQIVCPTLLYNQRRAGGGVAYAGIVGGSNYYWELETDHPAAKRFNDAYRARTDGQVPSDYGGYGYAGLFALLEGIKAAGTTETDAVIEAMRTMRYNPYKGEQYYRECDHQAVQPVLVLESKPEAEVEDEFGVFRILHVDPADESKLRTCEELGHV